MPGSMSAQQVLERTFLDMRCKVLDLAAALDRFDEATGAAPLRQEDARVRNLEMAIRALLDHEPGRAERVQMIFSDAYEPKWERPAHR
jgi:hypothetical protein